MPTLEFKGKQFVYSHHLSVPFRELKIVPEKSFPVEGQKPSLDDNLIIHGDNLEALKALLPTHAGKVDCIFIDPPYNTGNEGWCYNDNVRSPLMKEWLKKSANPVDKEDLERHDKWLCMMWPRLNLLRELLHEDGLLFISIDDNEADKLQIIISEIFGDDSVLGRFIWKSRQNKDNRNIAGLSNDHEYVLIVGKQIEGDTRSGDGFLNPDNDLRGAWTSGNMVGLASIEERRNLHYPLIDPDTKINYGCPPRGWRYEPSTMNKLIQEKRILWPASATGRPREKCFLDKLPDKTNASTVIDRPIFTRDGTDAFERIMGNRTFAFPKPPELIEYLLGQHYNSNAVILDSFAGSGTTAHAVLAANQKDGGNRRFILIECEDYADTLTAERVRRIINGYPFSGTQREELFSEKITWTNFSKKSQKLLLEVEHIEKAKGAAFDSVKKEIKDGLLTVTGERKISETAPGLGGSFTYCTLGEPIEIENLLTGKALPNFDALARYVFYTATGRSLETVAAPSTDGFIGETELFRIHLFYQPDTAWLRSNESALNAERVAAIATGNKSGKRSIVFAVAKFMSQKELTKERIEFCQLPYAVHRILGD
jgi:adenine-specific DNA-methyltransferase